MTFSGPTLLREFGIASSRAGATRIKQQGQIHCTCAASQLKTYSKDLESLKHRIPHQSNLDTPLKMPPFKDEHILIIAPGSQTTLAQLGLPESFTPASHRIPTRVFPAPDGKTFEPYKIRSRKKVVANSGADVEMGGTGEAKPEDEEELIELPEDDEGAIYPLKGTYSVTL